MSVSHRGRLALLPHLAELVQSPVPRAASNSLPVPACHAVLAKELPVQHHRGVVSSTVTISAPKLHGRFSSQCLQATRWPAPSAANPTSDRSRWSAYQHAFPRHIQEQAAHPFG